MGSKLIPTLICIAIIFLVIALMKQGWSNRQKSQKSWGKLSEVPLQYDEKNPLAVFSGTYVCTTLEGDWLERVSAESLGVKAAGQLFIFDDGLIISRVGAQDIYLSAPEIRGVRTESGVNGKFVEKDGLLVVSWLFGNYPVDSAFRTQFSEDKKTAQRMILDLAPDAFTALPHS